jgi:MarR family transcriptional regulator, transcriptional regulator for hemolysin
MLTILMPNVDSEPFGLLLHGTARAWRLKLDGRLKPMGLSQAKWRTLLHLSIASGPLTQAEVASRLGIEEPTLVTLLHRLERGGWVTRRNASHDRRCKTVHLGKKAHQVITRINAAAAKLRHELLDDIPPSQLLICMRVLGAIRDKAEREDGGRGRVRAARNGQTRNGHAIMTSRASRRDGK